MGGRSGRDWSGSLLKQVTLTTGRQERPKEAPWRTLPEKEPAKQLKRKARLPATKINVTCCNIFLNCTVRCGIYERRGSCTANFEW